MYVRINNSLENQRTREREKGKERGEEEKKEEKTVRWYMCMCVHMMSNVCRRHHILGYSTMCTTTTRISKGLV